MSRANEFLIEWTLKRGNDPISRQEATEAALRWEAEAEENGISASQLRQAAQGDIAAYLLRTFGEA